MFPLEFRFEKFPKSLNWVEFRTVSRLKNRDNIIGKIESFRFVKRALVKLNNRDIITKVIREQFQEVLKTITIEVGELIKKAVST